MWIRSIRVVRTSDWKCYSRKSPGLDPSILRHSGILGTADEAVLNNVHKYFFFKRFILKIGVGGVLLSLLLPF
jgi:hypothetical protein